MIDTTALARDYLDRLNARDWDRWQQLLSEDVRYELPQSRELIRGISALRTFNVEYPGDWRLVAKRVLGDGRHAVIWFGWVSGDDRADAVSFLEFGDDGLIRVITEFWPEPYEPPERPAGIVEGLPPDEAGVG